MINIIDDVRYNINNNILGIVWTNVKWHVLISIRSIEDNINDNVDFNVSNNVRDNVWDNIRNQSVSDDVFDRVYDKVTV